METVCVVSGQDKIITSLCALMIDADKSIYISLPCLDLYHVIDNKKESEESSCKTFYDLLCEISKKDVEVHILVPEGGIIDNPPYPLYHKDVNDVKDIKENKDRKDNKENKRYTKLPKNCFIHFVWDFGPILKDELIVWRPTLVKILNENKGKNTKVNDLLRLGEKGIYKHNQSYILIDSSTFIIGSILFYDARYDSHAIIAIGKASEDFVRFCNNQFSTSYSPYLSCSYSSSPSASLSSSSSSSQSLSSSSSKSIPSLPVKINSEVITTNQDKLICKLINESKRYIYIESSMLLSHNDTENNIANCIVDRLLRAHNSNNKKINENDEEEEKESYNESDNENGDENDNENDEFNNKNNEEETDNIDNYDDKFQCIIFINEFSNFSTSLEPRSHISKKINYTLEYITMKIQEAGISPSALRNRIFIGFLNHLNIQSLLVIQDGLNCLVSSGSICDRSLGNQNSELGIIISGPKIVDDLQRSLWSKHFEYHDRLSFKDVFNICLSSVLEENEENNIKKCKLWTNQIESNLFKISDIVLSNFIGKLSYK